MYKIYFFDENWGVRGERIADSKAELLHLLNTLPKNGYVVERYEEVKINTSRARNIW